MDTELEDVPFQFLREITDGFSKERILGEGAFGVVYKGVTRNGDDVAVKKLRNIRTNLDYKPFQNEFYNLSKLKHQNIVQVLGYCHETVKEPIDMPNGSKVFADVIYGALFFEYLHNGSLQKYLSDEYDEVLDWDTRFKIIKGTCEGLKYIHEEGIYHLDLKPENILLDKDMVPKIADFGLSRIFDVELTRTAQGSYGTLGYQPPEYIDTGEISGKFDIFSLGVVIIRIVSGSHGYPRCLDMPSDVFIDEVQKNWRNRLPPTCSTDWLDAYCHQVETCTRLALNCLDKDSEKRPDIVMIAEKLKETETRVGKLLKKRCLKFDSKMTMHNSKKKMRMEPKDIIGQQQKFNLMSDPSCTEQEFVDARATSSYVLEKLIVGRTEEKEEIMTLIEGMQEKILILPIHGIGGIGKTTFARLIYNDPMFNCYSQVWVHVSQKFDLNKIYKSIILQLSGKESLAIERPMIHSYLKELLPGKKILIVLDDLWDDNQFQLEELKDMLYHDDSNIIILVTTRSELVAKRICTNLQPYRILPLTNDMCWDIIKQRSGFKDRIDKKQLMGIGQEIARKCGGVALAAVSLGFTLRSMNFDQWMKVKDSDIWNEPVLKDFSLPNHVLASLKLSYSYMSPGLKLCFTYCATLPKGHKIFKNDLIYQWISLDFIKPTKLHSNMQLGEKYVEHLLRLSFFQHSVPPKASVVYHEDATLFTMHDLVHDLAKSILADKILNPSQQGKNGGTCCCYALLTDCSRPLVLSTPSPGILRALRFLKCGEIELCGSAFSSARYLCVLDLSECCIQKLPDSIGQLEELRYLNAPGIKDQSIPNSITNLSKLSYLNIRESSEILALPEEIGEMDGLTYLDLSGCTKIQKLPKSFGNLKKLDHLDLSNCSEVTGVSQLLGSLLKLQYLDLSYCKNIGKLHNALGNLTELQYLNLSHSSYLHVHVVEVLGSLTKLVYLNLSSERSSFKRLPESLGSFTELKYLNLSGCMYLEILPKSFGKLRSMVHLDLSRCYIVEGVPEALRGLTKLQYLNLGSCSSLEDQHFEGLRGLQEVIGSLTELCYLNLGSCLPHMFGFDDQEGEQINKFLQLIGTLFNLEHLDLSHNYNIDSLPEILGGLRKLHTLNLSGCSELQRLPASIWQIGSLKWLNTMNCEKLDKSMIPQFNNTSILFPHFVVRATEGEFISSTLVQLKDENPPTLEISKLENVKSVQEAQRIKLRDKKLMDDLTFVWTRDAKRFMEDIELLKELVPADTLTKFEIKGYSGTTFPCWVMGIAEYLPHLVRIFISELPRCHTLPALGQLPNLESLRIQGMDSIGKIDEDLYGGAGGFPQLEFLYLIDMKNLEEWNMTCTSGEDDANIFVFRNLSILVIDNCPKLQLKPCPPRARGVYHWDIVRSDDVMSSWEEIGLIDDYRYEEISIQVEHCEVPLDRWRLLHHLPGLTSLTIRDCSDLPCSSPNIIEGLCSLESLTVSNCESIAELPDWLGELDSLLMLRIEYCGSINALPDSVQQLTNLSHLEIF